MYLYLCIENVHFLHAETHAIPFCFLIGKFWRAQRRLYLQLFELVCPSLLPPPPRGIAKQRYAVITTKAIISKCFVVGNYVPHLISHTRLSRDAVFCTRKQPVRSSWCWQFEIRINNCQFEIRINLAPIRIVTHLAVLSLYSWNPFTPKNSCKGLFCVQHNNAACSGDTVSAIDAPIFFTSKPRHRLVIIIIVTQVR